MSAKWMKAVNITSSLSKREKILLKPLSRRNNRSISLRRRYMTRSYCHGLTRPCLGGTTGVNPSSNTNYRVSPPSYARSMIMDTVECTGFNMRSSSRPSGASWLWPGESENVIAVRASAATI